MSRASTGVSRGPNGPVRPATQPLRVHGRCATVDLPAADKGGCALLLLNQPSTRNAIEAS
jgi:hypothetical protein